MLNNQRVLFIIYKWIYLRTFIRPLRLKTCWNRFGEVHFSLRLRAKVSCHPSKQFDSWPESSELEEVFTSQASNSGLSCHTPGHENSDRRRLRSLIMFSAYYNVTAFIGIPCAQTYHVPRRHLVGGSLGAPKSGSLRAPKSGSLGAPKSDIRDT